MSTGSLNLPGASASSETDVSARVKNSLELKGWSHTFFSG